MTDPTPTPDTLRAASPARTDGIHRLADLIAHDRGATGRGADYLWVAVGYAAVLADQPDPSTLDLDDTVTKPAAAAPTVEQVADALYLLEWKTSLYATPRGRLTALYERRAARLLADPRLPWAVERATPDPDTLAALLADVGGRDLTRTYWLNVARALIAAGVTLNQPTT